MSIAKLSSILVGTCVLLLVAVTVLLTGAKQRQYMGGGFKRIYHSNSLLKAIDTLSLKYDSYSIAGGTEHVVYLGNYASPVLVTEVRIPSLETSLLTINTKSYSGTQFKSLSVKIDSPVFYLYDGRVPLLLTGNIYNGSTIKRDLETNYFVDLLPFDSGSVMLKSLFTKNEMRLGILNYPNSAHFRKGILTKQVDGVFCTDGTMLKLPSQNALIYLYHYRNEYLILDSALNLIRNRKTIDTTSHAKISITDIESNHSRTYRGTPPFVNRKAAVSKNHLYIVSEMRADNDLEELFENAAVIDIYELNAGRYVSSIQIPSFGGGKIRAIHVSEKFLVVLYKRHLLLYALPARERHYM